MKTNGTPVYTRQHKRGLTLPQLSAIDLLVSGKTDTQAAELLKLSRTCIPGESILHTFDRLNVWQRSGQRAPLALRARQLRPDQAVAKERPCWV
jgi:hypothetical protein